MIAFSFSSSGKIPLYEQLYRHLKEQIEYGGLKPESKLISCRKLADYLEVSLSTVLNAYAQLKAEGYIDSKPKRGYYVCQIDSGILGKRKTFREVKTSAQEDGFLFDLSTNGVDVNLFPFSVWAKLSRQVLSIRNAALLKPVHPQGDPRLREQIAIYLNSYRGMEVSPSQVIIGAGTEFLLGLLVELLNRPSFAHESPCYPKIPKILQNRGVHIHQIPVDEQGMSFTALENSPANVAFVTPSHHFPLGMTMSIGRRSQLLRWANEKEGRYIIEDDYHSEFRFDFKPVPALHSLDKNGKVIYLNTFTQTVVPSLRISYIVLPPHLAEEFNSRMSFYYCSVSGFDQHILTKFLQGGYYDRHLNRLRACYRKKRNLLLGLFSKYENLQISGQGAGLHLLLTVRNGMTDRQLAGLASQRGVRINPLSDYYYPANPSETETVLMGYAALSDSELAEVSEILTKAWELHEPDN